MAKFIRNTKYDDQFDALENINGIGNIKLYPYVGQLYSKETPKRVLVYAHNIYISPDKIKEENLRTKSKTHHADALEAYTYHQGWWTKAFRNFIKGSVSINENYTTQSKPEIIDKIDAFVNCIAYTNYINGLVPTTSKTNVPVSEELKSKSHLINKEIIRILEPTHIVCWGRPVFEYIGGIADNDVTTTNNLNDFKKLKKKGFRYAKKKINGNIVQVLGTFHPSMPSFGGRTKGTHDLFEWFFNLE